MLGCWVNYQGGAAIAKLLWCRTQELWVRTVMGALSKLSSSSRPEQTSRLYHVTYTQCARITCDWLTVCVYMESQKSQCLCWLLALNLPAAVQDIRLIYLLASLVQKASQNLELPSFRFLKQSRGNKCFNPDKSIALRYIYWWAMAVF